MSRQSAWTVSIILGIALSALVGIVQSGEVERQLMEAASAGKVEEVKLLLTDDIDIDIRAVLSAAVRGNHFDVVKYLVDQGADTNHLLMSHGPGSSPLFTIVEDGHSEIFEYLLARGADIDQEKPGSASTINTPLIAAVYYGDLSAARILIRYGADVNYVNKHGNTALLQAIRFTGGDGDEDLTMAFIELLISNGADPDMPDRDGITGRQYARASQKAELSELIDSAKPLPAGAVQVGADVLEEMRMVLLYKAACDLAVPGFGEKTADVYRDWRRRNADLIEQIERSPAFNEQVSEMKGKAAVQSKTVNGLEADRYKSDMTDICEDAVLVQLSLDRSAGPDPKLATPELTWAYYLESLRSGDRDSALSCLVSTARSKFRDVIKSASDEQLRRMGESMKAFTLTGVSFGNFTEGVATRHDGHTGMIYFQNVGGEWKINEM